MQFARKLTLFDATMIVISGVIGSGIFINPYLVAQSVKTTPMILAVWLTGGLVALAGAFVFAELATVMPKVGGQYAFFREAFHPLGDGALGLERGRRELGDVEEVGGLQVLVAPLGRGIDAVDVNRDVGLETVE